MAVRARSTIDILARLGVRTTTISHSEPVTPFPASIDELHVLRRPLRLGWSIELTREVRRRARDVDAIIVVSALLLPAVRAARPRVPVLWDSTECETLHYSRVATTFENRLRGAVWRMIERWAVAQTDVIIAISETEAVWWNRLFRGAHGKVAVVHHHSLVRLFPHKASRVDLEQLCGKSLRRKVLLFVGNVAAKHNAVAATWLVRELGPQLPPDCSLVLAGPGTESLTPPRPQARQILCLGDVSDIDTVIAGADVCLAPLAAGAGVKTKILDYVAHGRPILATPVAIEGIEDAPGVYTAELHQFGPRLAELLSHPDDSEEVRNREHAQRLWMRARHGGDLVADQWCAVLRRVGVDIG
jgi:hypothetical protein